MRERTSSSTIIVMTSGNSIQPQWLPIIDSDLDIINRIADEVHTSLPERPEVFAEKSKLFPAGCRKFVYKGKTVGYGFSHPWSLNSIPPLDTFLENLPEDPECIYIHDVVVLPQARGKGAAAAYISYLEHVASNLGIDTMALVSVYGTDRLWSRFGFRIAHSTEVDKKLSSYGPTAKYMIRK